MQQFLCRVELEGTEDELAPEPLQPSWCLCGLWMSELLSQEPWGREWWGEGAAATAH